MHETAIEDVGQGTKIKVIGVGGAGGEIVDCMNLNRVAGIEFLYADTDMEALCRRPTHLLVPLHIDDAGKLAQPETGRQAAEMAVDKIRAMLGGVHMLFITAGMGGGTGTGAVPVIAREAKEMGILTVGVVTKPFDWEGGRRMRNANAGLTELAVNVDALIVVRHEKLVNMLGKNITQFDAFAHANDVVKNVVEGIAERVNVLGLNHPVKKLIPMFACEAVELQFCRYVIQPR